MPTVTLHEKEFWSANGLKVSVGTTGRKGGDTGHGGRTVFAIHDIGGTDMKVIPDANGVTIELGGDTELMTFYEALLFAAQVLREEMRRNNDEDEEDDSPTQREYQTSF
jgi:hypothetical protein